MKNKKANPRSESFRIARGLKKFDRKIFKGGKTKSLYRKLTFWLYCTRQIPGRLPAKTDVRVIQEEEVVVVQGYKTQIVKIFFRPLSK